MPKATSAGIAAGAMTRQTMPYSLMPSIRAASIRSSGTPRKNWRIRKMPNTEMVKGSTSEA